MIDKLKIRKKIEKKLNKTYLKHLVAIENASKNIWIPDIRIIKYYTDHGVKHSYRIIDYIFKILENKNVDLSMEDYFILFSSAFLHDIGMQCDLNKHIELKKKLKNNNLLKNEFNNTSLSYTNDEIQELRQIHNVVSHNWIIQACKKESIDEEMNQVIHNINNPLIIQDIADIVLFHTKKNINDLNNSCYYDPVKKNKKMLAALFRLADELDIDATRVKNINSLSNFSIEPYSEFIWWLHNKLKISFDKNDNIVLTINLNKLDKQYFNDIKNILFKQFTEKNTEIIKILYDSYINVTIKEINIKELDVMDLIPKKYYHFLTEAVPEEQNKEKHAFLNTRNIIPSMFNSCNKIGYGTLPFYELWEGKLGETVYYLILGKRKVEDSIKEAYKDIKKYNIEKITIISPTVKKQSIEKFIKLNNIIIDVNIYELYDFVWEFIVERKLKEIKTPPIENYTEQALFTHNNLSETLEENLGNAYSYLYNQYVLEKNKNESKEQEPIFVQARGGTGKSYLLEKLCFEINKYTKATKKIALIISSERFIENIRKVNTNEKIDSLHKLIQIYADAVLGIRLDEKNIIQSFATGNLVVLIDGIDEYISIYNENFLIDDFFNSIASLYKELHNAKIIISSRFSPKMVNIIQKDSIKKCLVKGFDCTSLTNYIDQRLPNDDKNKERLIEKIKDFFEGETYFSPFFIKVIVDQYLKNNKKENKNFELKNTMHKKNKDLVYFLIEREIDRQTYNIPIDTIYKIFFEIVLMMENKNNYIYIEDLKLAIESIIGRDDSEFLDKFLINPLFDRTRSTVSFKFSFVKNYFMSRYLKSSLDDHLAESKILSDEFRDKFSPYYTGYGEVFQQLVEMFKDNTNLEDIVKNVLTHTKVYTEEKYKQLTSALIYLLFNALENDLQTSVDRTNILLRLNNSSKTIKHLYVYGDFYPISFENIVVEDSIFNGYCNFSLSEFNSQSYFNNCILDIVIKEHKDNKYLTNSLFNTNCKSSKELLNECKKNEIYVNKEMGQMVDNFYAIIQKFMKYDSLDSCKIFSTSVVNKDFDNTKILNYLKEIKFISRSLNIVDSYEISAQYRKSILKLSKKQTIYSLDIIDVIKKLNHKFFHFNDNDIDNYFKELASS